MSAAREACICTVQQRPIGTHGPKCANYPGPFDPPRERIDRPDPEPEFLTPGEVATMLRVVPATVRQWDKAGLLKSFRTPGNHRRYSGAQVRAILADLRQS